MAPLNTRTFLVHGLIAGLLAGIASFVVAFTIGEPSIDAAIAREEMAAAHAADHAAEGGTAQAEPGHSHDDEDAVVSRATQSTWGLATGVVSIGVVLGGLTGILSALALGRLGRLRPVGSTAVVALLGYVSFSLVPALKYPATPPAVGAADTIDFRTWTFFGFLLVSLVAVVAATQVARLMSRSRPGPIGVIAGAATYVVIVAVAAFVFPKVDELGSFPASVLWDFRIASLLTVATTWAVIGAVLAFLVDRTWRQHEADQARRELAASL